MEQMSEMNGIDFASILGDKYSAIILTATNKQSSGALEISQRYGIPIAACYRRINQLEKIGLILKDERILTREGKRMWRYISNIHTMSIYFSDGRLTANCELRNGYSRMVEGGESIVSPEL